MKTFDIAYIGYMECQNEPSDPSIGQVRKGHIKEDLETIFTTQICDNEDGEEVVFKRGKHWGHLQLDLGSGPMHLFVTFREDEKEEALKEALKKGKKK